jgi:sulfite oxidase
MNRPGSMNTLSRRDFLSASAGLAGLIALRPRGAFADAIPPGKAHDLIIRGESPFNAEPRLSALVQHDLTPVEQFFVRSHAPVPETDLQTFRLTIEGLVHQPLELSVAEIRERFKSREITATLTCAGNRRNEHAAMKPLSGVPWDAGAISTCTWQGASLGDLLAAAGIKEGAKHVWFEGRDRVKEKDGGTITFDGSIPLERLGQVNDRTLPLVAYGMAGKDLPAHHGYPLRTIIPGYIGARSVKWLGKIVVSDRPSSNRFVASDYKIVSREEPALYAAAEPIYNCATNAVICTPAAGAPLAPGKTRLAGYALAAGEPGCRVVDVEVSRNGGKTWTKATLGESRAGFNWLFWHVEIDLPPGNHEIVCRATDSRGFTMPERIEWNAKGYLFNAWHRVAVKVG